MNLILTLNGNGKASTHSWGYIGNLQAANVVLFAGEGLSKAPPHELSSQVKSEGLTVFTLLPRPPRTTVLLNGEAEAYIEKNRNNGDSVSSIGRYMN